MLEDYRRLLDRLRRDPATWGEISYQEGQDAEGHAIDVHERERFGIVLCLQYDRLPADEALIRHVVTEEIRAAEDDGLAGYSETLRIGATLLASFHVLHDAWLFCRAKKANFDTYCGFDRRFLLSAGVHATFQMVRDSNHPDQEGFLDLVLKNGIAEYAQADIDVWFADQQQSLATSLADEHLETVINYALTLGAIDEGRTTLEQWEATAGSERRTLHTLMYYHDQLGQPKRALACAQRMVMAEGHDPLDHASGLLEVARLSTQVGQYTAALTSLHDVVRFFDDHPDWRYIGLARHAVGELFTLAVASDALTGKKAFALAAAQAHRVPNLPLVVLQKAEQAAVVLEETTWAKYYGRAIAKEEKRIGKMMR